MSLLHLIAYIFGVALVGAISFGVVAATTMGGPEAPNYKTLDLFLGPVFFMVAPGLVALAVLCHFMGWGSWVLPLLGLACLCLVAMPAWAVILGLGAGAAR
jgi:hypothetical protein